MPNPPKNPRGPTVPPDFPVTPPPSLPSGDYSYTVELVGTLQHQLGGISEAVESLKELTKEQGKELKGLGRDIHAAKVVIGVVGGFIGVVGIFLGIVLKALLDYFLRTSFK